MMTDSSLLEITASLDQPIPFDTAHILSKVDEVVKKLLKSEIQKVRSMLEQN